MFGYPGLDAGLNTLRFGGDIAFAIGRVGRGLPSLVYATSSQLISLLINPKMKQHLTGNEVFEFKSVSPLEVWEEINKLDKSKKTSSEISSDVVKLISGFSLEHITYFINKMFSSNKFPGKLKLADVSPIFKCGESTQKANFRPISVLSAFSKVFERIMSKQIQPFTSKFLSSLLCAFQNGHSTQHALFRLIETCRKTLDEKGVVGMVLMDLSKAYDCLPHGLLIAKLAAYGFGQNSLALISNYLSQRKQRVNVGSIFSEFQEIASGVPQGSVLGPLFFNIFVNDFIFAMKSSHTCNFADDNTVYACDKDVESVAMRLEDDISRALDWYKDNRMVANPKKVQVMFLGLKQHQEFFLEIEHKSIDVTRSVKLLGISVDDCWGYCEFPLLKEMTLTLIGSLINGTSEAFWGMRNFTKEG